MKKILGKMNQSIKLLGTGLFLNKNEIVSLEIPSNLPKSNKIQWFARPHKNRKDWLGGENDSILIDASEVTLKGIIPGKGKKI